MPCTSVPMYWVSAVIQQSVFNTHNGAVHYVDFLVLRSPISIGGPFFIKKLVCVKLLYFKGPKKSSSLQLDHHYLSYTGIYIPAYWEPNIILE